MHSAPSKNAHFAEDTTTTPSDGAHLAETPQVVEDPNCDSKTWKDMLGDDRILRKKGRGQPAATQKGQPAATQEGEDGTHCGDTHPTVSGAGSGSSSDSAPAVLEFRRGVRVVNDAKIREQLFYAVTNAAELIGSITYLDEKMNTSGLSGPLRDLFEGPLSELLSELKNHQEMISVLTEWGAKAGLHIPRDSNPTRNDLHPIVTSHRGDTHPTVQEGTLCLPSSSVSSYLPFNPPLYLATIRSIMEHYNAGCVFNNESQQWSVPVTHHLDLIDEFHWAKMLDFGEEFPPGKSIVSTVPTFYLDEPDHNHRNKPRLDILVSFTDGETVRYHPRAHLIWSSSQQPTDAMRNRYKLREKLQKKIEKAQR